MTLHDVKKILRVDWPHTTAAEAMIPAENMKRILPDAELVNALAEMDHDGVNQLPVMVGDQIQGVLCRDAAIGLLRTLSEFRRKKTHRPYV